MFLSAGIHWYGALIALGMIAGMVGAWFGARYRGYDPDVVFDICIWAIPCALVGARLNFVLSEALSGRPMSFGEVFGFENGRFVGLAGLSIFGGIIGGVLGVFFNSLVYKHKKRPETFFHMLDIAAPFIILGQAIGRWGNFANGELYGQPVGEMWQWFPAAVQVDGNWFQALFFYESVLDLAGCALLLWMWLGPRRSRSGAVVGMYFMWYGLVRFFLEGLRQEEFIMYWFGVLRVSQLSAALIFLVGLVFYLVVIYKARVGGKPVPLFVRRGDWEKTGFAMFDWGRDPAVPLPPLRKKKAAEVDADEEPIDPDAPDGTDGTEDADGGTDGDTDEQTDDAGEQTDDAPDGDAQGEPADEPADGFGRKKYAGKDE